jgi:hypothetical protein
MVSSNSRFCAIAASTGSREPAEREGEEAAATPPSRDGFSRDAGRQTHPSLKCYRGHGQLNEKNNCNRVERNDHALTLFHDRNQM